MRKNMKRKERKKIAIRVLLVLSWLFMAALLTVLHLKTQSDVTEGKAEAPAKVRLQASSGKTGAWSATAVRP